MKVRVSAVLMLLILSSNALFGRSEGYLNFYKTYKSHVDVTSLDIPTFFVRFFLFGEDNNELRSILKKTDDFKIFVAEDSGYQLLPILNEYLFKNAYEDAMIVKEDGEIITFKTKGNEKLITEIILIVDEVNSFVVVSIRGEFTSEDMRKYIRAVKAKNISSGD